MQSKPKVQRIDDATAERLRNSLDAPWPRMASNGSYYVEVEPFKTWMAAHPHVAEPLR